MSIIRGKHNKQNPYVQLNKEALWDPNLSLKAIGLWARCLSRPDDWEFNVKEMASSGKEGKTAIYSALDELIQNGYAIKVQRKNLKNHFDGFDYVIFEFQLSSDELKEEMEELKKSFPHSGFPFTGNPPQLKTESSLINKEDKTKKEKTSCPVFLGSTHEERAKRAGRDFQENLETLASWGYKGEGLETLASTYKKHELISAYEFMKKSKKKKADEGKDIKNPLGYFRRILENQRDEGKSGEKK